MSSVIVKEHREINELLNRVDHACTQALYNGPVEVIIKRPDNPRNLDQNAKLWAMLKDFEPIEFNGRKWKADQWKCFVTSALNQEMPAVGLLGEPVTMTTSTSKLSKKRFAELIEFIYSVGSDKGVVWSEKALDIYDEYKEAK